MSTHDIGQIGVADRLPRHLLQRRQERAHHRPETLGVHRNAIIDDHCLDKVLVVEDAQRGFNCRPLARQDMLGWRVVAADLDDAVLVGASRHPDGSKMQESLPYPRKGITQTVRLTHSLRALLDAHPLDRSATTCERARYCDQDHGSDEGHHDAATNRAVRATLMAQHASHSLKKHLDIEGLRKCTYAELVKPRLMLV